MKSLILIRGVPGSGKTTLAHMLQQTLVHWHWHYEADNFFVNDDGEYVFDASKLGEAHATCFKQTAYSLSVSEGVIVSNTFTTLKELRPYFELAKKHDIRPVVYLAQNQFKSVHGVPEEAMERMRNRFVYDISLLYEIF